MHTNAQTGVVTFRPLIRTPSLTSERGLTDGGRALRSGKKIPIAILSRIKHNPSVYDQSFVTGFKTAQIEQERKEARKQGAK